MKDNCMRFPMVPKALLVVELLFDKEKVPRIFRKKINLRKTALKFTKVYSFISLTKAHHIKLKFCTVEVKINTDILMEFHFDSCESSQDMAFSAMLLPSCPRTCSILEAVSVNCRSIVVFLVTFALRNDVGI